MRSYSRQPIGTVPRARQLRCDAPEPERRLLRGLREAWPRLKWRHQVPVGAYFADILCWTERMVIEVDGDTHAGNGAYDAARDAFLRREGYRVLRFANDDVMRNIEGVLAAVAMALAANGKGGCP